MTTITKTLAILFIAVNVLAVCYFTVTSVGPVIHAEYHEHIAK